MTQQQRENVNSNDYICIESKIIKDISMLGIKFVRENPDVVTEAMKVKNIDLDVNTLLDLDKEIVSLKQQDQEFRTDINNISNQIKSASNDDRPALIESSREKKDQLKEVSEDLRTKEDELKNLLYLTPTIPDVGAPVGESDKDNIVVREVGEKPKFDFEPRSQMDLLEMNDWADFKSIPKVCGSRSVGIKGELLIYEMALWQYMMGKLIKKDFVPISVPIHVREEALVAMGQFPAHKEEVYELAQDDMYLAGTSEVVLNSMHAGEILEEDQLPIMYGGFSPCFRKEAGSAGKDVKGLIRVHQFFKVEQYVICKNDIEESTKMHDWMLANSEELLADLDLPYQIVDCCTGDMGTGKYRMYDIETWCPSEDKYRETHSCSTLLDWQARRGNIRYRDKETGEVKFVHTLNNTGIATPRIFVMLLENHQNEDGSVNIPKAVQPYMGGITKIGGKN